MPQSDPRCSTKEQLQPDGMIEVAVGDEKTSFFIHKQRLLKTSEYFRRALKDWWKEGQDQKVQLPDVSTEDFGRYYNWLYTNKLAVLEVQTEYTAICHSYVLAERLQDAAFANTCIDALVAKFEEPTHYVPSVKVVAYVYQNTTERCPLREVVLDIWVLCAGQALAEECKDLPEEFSVALVPKLLQRERPDVKRRLSRSKHYKQNPPTGATIERTRKAEDDNP